MRTLVKMAAASTIAATCAFSGTATAMMLGYPGEALLVPFAVHGTSHNGSDEDFNTYVRITMPKSVGIDTIHNNFTAPNTTKGGYTAPGGNHTVNWFFYRKNGTLVTQGTLTMTGGDMDEFNLQDAMTDAGLKASTANAPGYLVFTTDAATDGSPADFVLTGDAYFTNEQDPAIDDPSTDDGFISIPVLALADGTDGSNPTFGDQVIYAGGVPSKVSPTITGIRTSIPDGDNADTSVFSARVTSDTDGGEETSTLVAVWLDKDYNLLGVPVDVVNEADRSCTISVDLTEQLNLLYVFHDGTGLRYHDTPFSYGGLANTMPQLCDPVGPAEIASLRFRLPEGTEGSGTAAVFSIVFNHGEEGAAGIPDNSAMAGQLGQDLGKTDN